MSNINEFLKLNRKEIKGIINSLEKQFNSYQFIEFFAQKFKTDYNDFIKRYKDKYGTVHSLIGKHLFANENEYGIKKDGHIYLINVHGKRSKVTQWRKLNR